VPVESGDVLYLALEDTAESLQGRMRGMMPAGDGWPERLEAVDMGHRIPKADAGGLEFLSAWLGKHPEARLVIIDVLQRFRSRSTGRNGNAYAEDYDELEPLQVLAGTHGVCVLLLHHYNKTMGQEDWVDRISGTAGVSGSCDTVLGLSGPRDGGEVREAVLQVVSRKMSAHDDYAMRGEGGHWFITGDAQAVAYGKETGLLLKVMAHIGRPCKPSEVAGYLGKQRNTTIKLMLRAAESGHIWSYGDGLYGLIEARK
jgi:hypothetical protein